MGPIEFYKYQGTGNDFVMLDNRDGKFDALTVGQIQRLCDRRFGIGADGLIKINTKKGYDFECDYYNSDGSQSFCGNGARCAVNFADFLGINQEEVHFLAIDGEHFARKDAGIVSLKMNNVSEVKKLQNQDGTDYELNTGSPHYIRLVKKSAESIDPNFIVELGKKIRYSDMYKNAGINVNYIRTEDMHGEIYTYERGVEDRTLSCGTGVTAGALAMCVDADLFGKQTIDFTTEGGKLKVSLTRNSDQEFTDIWLIGPAEHVFSGVWNG